MLYHNYMAKPILVANWKNHPSSLKEAADLLTTLSRRSMLYKKLSLYIAPPYTYFESVSKRIKGFANLASQDVFFSADGPHTGSVTPDILKSFGVKLAIIGHSERRALGETNEVVATKLKTAFIAGIVPLLCIGETSRDDEGNHLQFIQDQLKFSLEGIRRKEDAEKLIIAYEPVWAIGKRASEAMSPTDLAEMVIFIKKALTDIFGRDAADVIPVLYGGSVDGSNAEPLYKETGIRGFLVGRASLKSKEFCEIAEALISS
ncbi:MAG: triosephosphate isomerase, triosephosphate isomerase [Parcubacteria group bacterium]|nr:triosephosphate isomerase, triosephosphate isomerase [Parcubacteria group bacterium]